ncbi:MAG: asparagine synthase (glutamine-hydrolyzing) [Candidatus Micrarchaeota archaeon]
MKQLQEIEVCGIAGIVSEKALREPGLLQEMNLLMRHRGPDDEGFVLCGEGQCRPYGGVDTVFKGGFAYSPKARLPPKEVFEVGLAQRRLSIIDLSPAGHQPMCNEDKTIWLVFNGEIYNYLELIPELAARGHEFVSKCDTEVVIHAYEEYGDECVKKFNGMFAILLWDASKNKLFVARDRFGVKPLYYTQKDGVTFFASEIKPLLLARREKPSPNDKIVFDYLTSGLLDHTTETFFEKVFQVPLSHYGAWEKGKLEFTRYYSVKKGKAECSDDECAQKFRELFVDSIKLRLRSDVPVGHCLSGGLDSSSIACASAKYLEKGKQKTFSAVYPGEKVDESLFIGEVIKQTRSDAHYVTPRGENLFDLVKKVIRAQEEPFGSTSIFAQWHVFKLAKENGVTVMLDGQGADEILAGYHTYFSYYFAELLTGLRLNRFLKEIGAYQKLHGKTSLYSKSGLLNVAASIALPFTPVWLRSAARAYARGGVSWLSPSFEKQFERTDYLKRNRGEFTSPFGANLHANLTSMVLPALLHYEDRNSMAFSIEARVPFLDYRLVDFAYSLPADQKIRGGVTKIVLRNAMKGILPEKIRERMDKIGFATPEDEWMRGPAAKEARQILASESFGGRKYFNQERVLREFDEFVAGKKNTGRVLWRFICLELWLREFFDETIGR